jgi:hypothetical protein
MMASVSDSIRALTGVFTTLLQIMSDEPASSSWLPDADALDRPCRILFAIAVISDNLHATAEPFPGRLGLLLWREAQSRLVLPTATIRGPRPRRHCESRAMPQFGTSGDKIAQTVAVARYILRGGLFSATSGLFGHNWGAD